MSSVASGPAVAPPCRRFRRPPPLALCASFARAPFDSHSSSTGGASDWPSDCGARLTRSRASNSLGTHVVPNESALVLVVRESSRRACANLMWPSRNILCSSMLSTVYSWYAWRYASRCASRRALAASSAMNSRRGRCLRNVPVRGGWLWQHIAPGIPMSVVQGFNNKKKIGWHYPSLTSFRDPPQRCPPRRPRGERSASSYRRLSSATVQSSRVREVQPAPPRHG